MVVSSWNAGFFLLHTGKLPNSRSGRIRSGKFFYGVDNLAGQSSPLKRAEIQAARAAAEMGYEFVDIEVVKEPMGKFLRVYIDREEGISLDDLEKYHRAILPQMEDVDYDYMEVSSPGADRPLKKQKDFDRAAGLTVEVKLYRPMDGVKYFTRERRKAVYRRIDRPEGWQDRGPRRGSAGDLRRSEGSGHVPPPDRV